MAENPEGEEVEVALEGRLGKIWGRKERKGAFLLFLYAFYQTYAANLLPKGLVTQKFMRRRLQIFIPQIPTESIDLKSIKLNNK